MEIYYSFPSFNSLLKETKLENLTIWFKDVLESVDFICEYRGGTAVIVEKENSFHATAQRSFNNPQMVN